MRDSSLRVRLARRGIAFLVASACGLSSFAWAEDVVAVLSSHLEPYEEALKGFEQAYGSPVPSINLSNQRAGIDKATKIVVAFGSRATAQSYPSNIKLVYCMAPGAHPAEGKTSGRSIFISMAPPAATILHKIKILQPRLKRLGFLWISDNQEEFSVELLRAGQSARVEILSRRLGNTDELLDQLRALNAGHAEALWVPPDPQLLTPENFNVIRAFSRSSHIPFYIANEGFVDKGATAAVAASFEEIGRSAAKIVREMLGGNLLHNNVYPDKVVLVVGEKAAQDAGLNLTDSMRRKVDKVRP